MKNLSDTPPIRREAASMETSRVDHGHEYPRVPVAPRFLLAYDPKRWTIIEGFVVPLLITVPLTNGVNHVNQDGQGRFDLNKLRSKLDKEDRTLIPWSKGPGGRPYVDKVKTRTRSKQIRDTYVSVWCDVHAGDDRLYPRTKEYVAWLRELMANGTLPQPPAHVVRELLSDRTRKLRQAEVRAERQPSATRIERVKTLEAEVVQLKAMVEEGPTTPKVGKEPADLDEADAFDLEEDVDLDDDPSIDDDPNLDEDLD